MPTHDSPDHRRAAAILEALDRSRSATAVELATALETHPMTVERRCRSLQRDGYLRQCTGGAYTLAESDGGRNTATNPAD
ncbi:helix-turn-helix domain-containing protein [Natronorubrum halophilum]|uniref:helix-turn-helix domain-containing protein n=1 Tax=Natronorubrum halophilum TaxID=1702106 RepID=UPI000EF73257|nr:helix-turn-helix domain-containing protein [Natronorubrum halophilum]